jgi:DNA helicase HerA-like ATPase
MYLSSIFDWARKYRRARRVLIVLEEAHTVVPEINVYGRYDRSETESVLGRTAQIALQGRKYGVGLLLVSQRTALVSKTLLSQCNTVLSFAMYDETGLRYLANVFSTSHVTAIPNLKKYQAIAFGKGIKSERPVIFQIAEDPAKKKASEELNKQWQAVEVVAQLAVVEEAIVEEAIEPLPLLDDDDGTAPF